MAQDRYMAQYVTPKQLVYLTPERIVQLYEVFQDDMHASTTKVGCWKARWEVMNVAERPATLNNKFQDINPNLYPDMMYTAVVILIYKVALNQATAEIRNSKRSYEQKIAFNIKHDSKSFYAYVQSKQKVQDKVGPLEGIVMET